MNDTPSSPDFDHLIEMKIDIIEAIQKAQKHGVSTIRIGEFLQSFTTGYTSSQ